MEFPQKRVLNSIKLQFSFNFANEYKFLNALVFSRTNSFNFANEYKRLNALVFSCTSSLSNFRLANMNWQHMQQLNLANSDFNKNSKIDILLGTDIFYELLSRPSIYRNYGKPAAIPTLLSYIISGKTSSLTIKNSSVFSYMPQCRSFEIFYFRVHS